MCLLLEGTASTSNQASPSWGRLASHFRTSGVFAVTVNLYILKYSIFFGLEEDFLSVSSFSVQYILCFASYNAFYAFKNI